MASVHLSTQLQIVCGYGDRLGTRVGDQAVALGATNVLLEVLRSRAGRGDSAEEEGLANTTVLYYNAILECDKPCVCSLVCKNNP
jgi:hypothetical protein